METAIPQGVRNSSPKTTIFSPKTQETKSSTEASNKQMVTEHSEKNRYENKNPEETMRLRVVK